MDIEPLYEIAQGTENFIGRCLSEQIKYEPNRKF